MTEFEVLKSYHPTYSRGLTVDSYSIAIVTKMSFWVLGEKPTILPVEIEMQLFTFQINNYIYTYTSVALSK